MGLLDGYFDPVPFGEGGGLLGRLIALQQPQGSYRLGAGGDQATAAPQTPMPAPLLRQNLPDHRQTPSAPPALDLHSQYQALRSILGDRNAMLATVNPDVAKILIAQALAPHKPETIHDGALNNGR
jgi:hypothetical protein